MTGTKKQPNREIIGLHYVKGKPRQFILGQDYFSVLTFQLAFLEEPSDTQENLNLGPVSYTHLTLPTICSV